METPSSTRRITRSQASAMAAEKRGSREKSAEKPKQDRFALVDITNDSPIVGLAINHETPSSAMSKKRVIAAISKYTPTPGSGEALLRGQVKSLLQKVEEEAEISKITMEKRPLFDLQGLVSPALSLIAPTPANTPQLLNNDEQGTKSDDDMVTRTLLFDILEVTGGADDDEDEDDSSSIWSIQVNASSTREDEDEEGGVEDDGLLLDELCEDMSNMSVGLPKFTGKHIRFVYNSDDDEIGGEDEVVVVSGAAALAK